MCCQAGVELGQRRYRAREPHEAHVSSHQREGAHQCKSPIKFALNHGPCRGVVLCVSLEAFLSPGGSGALEAAARYFYNPDYKNEAQFAELLRDASRIDYVRETDDGCGSVLVVGHNPTMFHLTWDLLDDTSLDRERLDAVGFPTCALAVVDLGVAAWADVATGQGALVGLFTPPY